jgi:hypothetical protein
MSRIFVFVFFASSAASLMFSLQGVDINGALGLTILFSGVASLKILINGTAALIEPVFKMILGEPKKGRKQTHGRPAVR